MIIIAGERRAAFRVDALLDEREIVVRRLGSRVRRAAFVSGAALLGNNDVALVLDVAHLVHLARPGRSAAAVEAEPPRRRILVVGDSITTRQLMRSILETAGYDVTVAADGQEAWDRITAGASFDLIVSDIECRASTASRCWPASAPCPGPRGSRSSSSRRSPATSSAGALEPERKNDSKNEGCAIG